MTKTVPEVLTGFGGVSVERDVAVPMRDGVVLRADVYRPAGDRPRPVLVQRTPYGKVGGQSDRAFAHPAWYAAQGFVVAVQDVRGRFASEGDFYPWRHEATDGYDTVEWAARLPGVTGRVGMFGFSYAGHAQLLAAAQRPPSLAAIAPAMTAPQAYEGWVYDYGAFALSSATNWAATLGLDRAARDQDADTVAALGAALTDPGLAWMLPLDAHPVLTPEATPWYHDWLAHPLYDEYWKPFSVDDDFGAIDVPALHVAGTWDTFLRGTVASFRGLRAGAATEHARRHQRLVVAPLRHMPWAPIGGAGAQAAANHIDDRQLRFFGQHLAEQAPDEGGPVSVWVEGAGWRDFEDWPPPASTTTALHLRSGGRANGATGDGRLGGSPAGDELADVFVYNPGEPTLAHGGHAFGVDGVQPMGPQPQLAEATKTVLVYTGEALTEPLQIVGAVRLRLHAATTASDTDWVARLAAVDPGGTSVNVQEGVVRASLRTSRSTPDPVPPGVPVEYVIDLGPVAVRVPEGHRLRVTVTSSDFPQWARNPNTGRPSATDGPLDLVVATQTVLHDPEHPSRLELDVLPAGGTA